MAWNYERTEGTEFEKIPEGNHRVRIREAEKTISRNGNEMLRIVFDVSGTNSRLWHNIVFQPDRPEITNRRLTEFFESFKDIPEGNFNFMEWIGKTGAVKVVHNGEYVNVDRCIPFAKQKDLPAWKDAEGHASTEGGTMNGFTEIDDDSLPF